MIVYIRDCSVGCAVYMCKCVKRYVGNVAYADDFLDFFFFSLDSSVDRFLFFSSLLFSAPLLDVLALVVVVVMDAPVYVNAHDTSVQRIVGSFLSSPWLPVSKP